MTAHEVLDDSKSIFEDVLKMVKEVVDPQFEDITIFEQVKVVLDNGDVTPGRIKFMSGCFRVP